MCTSYDCKNQTNVDALLLSVSFKPIFVDFTLLIDMLLLLQFSLPLSCDKFFIYFAQFKHSEFFQSVCSVSKIKKIKALTMAYKTATKLAYRLRE